MKNKTAYILLFCLILTGAVLRPQASFGQYLGMAYTPFYWIIGGVADANGGAVKADGHMVVFYKDATTYNTSNVITTIYSNTFSLNAFLLPADLVVGGTYKVAIPNDNPSNPAEGWGADPVDVVITGTGFVNLGNLLVLTKGAGPMPPITGAAELPPIIKIWFGNRLYQKALVQKGTPFVVSAKPDIKVDITSTLPYTLAPDISAHSIAYNAEAQSSQALPLTAANISNKVFATGTDPAENKVASMTLRYTFTDALKDGKYTFTVSSRTSGLLAMAASTTEVAEVEILGGPVRLIGVPLTFPSPFSISKQKTVYIQYTLSADANIEMYIINVSGERVKRFLCDAGTEGGSAGTNKVAWDGVTDFGQYAGNAIYVVTLISRDDGRLLGKVKLTIVD